MNNNFKEFGSERAKKIEKTPEKVVEQIQVINHNEPTINDLKHQ
jgi:hypothetical protein